MRTVAWAFFALMWIPFAIFMFTVSSREPADSDMLMIFVFLALLFTSIILLVISLIGPLLISWREGRIIRAQGTLVPAEITGVSDTGIYINSQPLLELAVRVHPPHEGAFDATVRRVIPFSAIPQVQPGSRLEVYYIPGTTRVAMQW